MDRAKLIEDVKSLYNDIDKCISELVIARGKRDEQGIADAHWHMESLMVNAQQMCSVILDSLQEEPVSEFLNTESMIESYKQRLISQANCVENSPLISMCLASYKHGINETLDTLILPNVQRTVKNRKEPVSEDLEEAAKLHVIETRGDDVVWDENAVCAMLDLMLAAR